MSQSSGERRLVRVFFLLFILSCIGLIETLNNHQIAYIRDSWQSHAREEISLIRFRLEASILADIYVANSLPTLVTLRPDLSAEDWNKLASRILRESKHVKVIGLAPNDVIHYIFPSKDNETALGLDFRTVPTQWASIVKARMSKKIFIAGPVNLVQGGRGLIVRIPIFTDPPDNQIYWGGCSLVLDWESLVLAWGSGRFVTATILPFAAWIALALMAICFMVSKALLITQLRQKRFISLPEVGRLRRQPNMICSATCLGIRST